MNDESHSKFQCIKSPTKLKLRKIKKAMFPTLLCFRWKPTAGTKLRPTAGGRRREKWKFSYLFIFLGGGFWLSENGRIEGCRVRLKYESMKETEGERWVQKFVRGTMRKNRKLIIFFEFFLFQLFFVFWGEECFLVAGKQRRGNSGKSKTLHVVLGGKWRDCPTWRGFEKADVSVMTP